MQVLVMHLELPKVIGVRYCSMIGDDPCANGHTISSHREPPLSTAMESARSDLGTPHRDGFGQTPNRAPRIVLRSSRSSFCVLATPAPSRNPVRYRTNDMAVSRRSIFPLTTVWTPPCASVWHRDDIGRASCEPPYRHALDRNQDLHPTGYYSPGICFGGYTSGCQRNHTGEGWTSDSRETAALCVPMYVQPCVNSSLVRQFNPGQN